MSVNVADSTNNRRTLALRLLDTSDSSVLADYVNTDYIRGTATFPDTARVYQSWNSIIIEADTTFRIQSGAVGVEPTSNVSTINVATAEPGGIITVKKVQSGAKGDRGLRGIQGPAGAGGSSFRGTWAAATYSIGDVVAYNNAFYIARADKLSSDTDNPDVDSDWLRTDDTTVYRGNWGSGNSYRVGDIVLNSNRIWITTADKTPPASSGPSADSDWHHLDSNVNFRGSWIGNGTYSYGSIVMYRNRLFMLNSELKLRVPTNPLADSDWIVLTNIQAAAGTAGIAEIATSAEATTGTNDAKIITPLKLQEKIDALDLGDESHYKGQWAAGVYAIGDVVRDNDKFYIASAPKTAADQDRAALDSDWLDITASGGTTVSQATESDAGIAAIATSQEAAAGTNDSKIMTPLKVQGRLDTMPNYQGNWSAGAYKIGDLVTYSNNFYIASAVRAASDTDAPDVDGTWRRLGDTTLYRGAWSSANPYSIGDIVTSRNRIWLATANISGTLQLLEPESNPNWHALDNNMSFRGGWIVNTGRYSYGDVVTHN